MEDKLKSLIDTFFCSVDIDKFYAQKQKEKLAAWLRENGVIVPPCKAGDTVYQIDDVRIYQGTVAEIVLNKLHTICVADITCFDERAIGKTVFLTREEAEKALAERKNENGK